MKRLAQISILSGLVLFAAMPAQARNLYNYDIDRVNQRQDRQDYRIRDGVRSGELTRREARKLRKQQRRIDHLLAEFCEDGRLSHRERRILARKQDRASRRIYEFKHNDAYRHAARHDSEDRWLWEARRRHAVRLLEDDG